MPRAGESVQVQHLRATLIEQLAKFDDPAVVREVLRLFDRDDAGKPLHASIRGAVVRAAGQHADRARFDRLLARLKAATGEEERHLLARALASGRDAERAEQLLAACLAGVAPANVASDIPGYMARHSPLGELAYRYTLTHWQRFAELAGTTGRTQLLPKAAAGFNDEARAGSLVDDQRKQAGADGDSAAAREASNIRLRAAMKARYAGQMPELHAAGSR